MTNYEIYAEKNELRERVRYLRRQIEETIKFNEEWAETNRTWQNLCERMMGQ